MQNLTKVEIHWVADELIKLAVALRLNSEKEGAAGLAAGMMRLKSEQYESIAKRLQKALDDGNKRIEIKY